MAYIKADVVYHESPAIAATSPPTCAEGNAETKTSASEDEGDETAGAETADADVGLDAVGEFAASAGTSAFAFAPPNTPPNHPFPPFGSVEAYRTCVAPARNPPWGKRVPVRAPNARRLAAHPTF
jgi:hypothetical protein